MNRSTLGTLAVTLASMVAPAIAHAVPINLLANSGFETGDFSGWTVGGNSVQTQVNVDGVSIFGTHPQFVPTFLNVRSGQFAANALVRTSPLEQIFLDQTISVAANQTYNIGYWVGVDSPNQNGYGFGDFENDILVNGVSLALTGLGVINQGSTPGSFQHVFGSFTTGPNQTVANVSYRIAGSGTGRAGFSLDDFHFTGEAQQVPEPATLALFGVGLVWLGLRRRKI